MAVSDWLRPPRHLIVLFLGIALILMSTLAWLGWRLFQQDRALERQRVQVRLEHAADIVTAELTRRLAGIEDRLARLASIPSVEIPDSANQYAALFCRDAVVLVLDEGELAAYPGGRLPFYPVAPTRPEADARVFAAGEVLEFRQRDLAGAANVYRGIARSTDPAVRAGALLRLARVERKARRHADALAAYDELAQLDGTALGGLPAELVARHARLAVLDSARQPEELRREADSLRVDVETGRWRLDRAQYEFFARDVCRWIDCDSDADATHVQSKRALAAAAEWLWDRRGTLERDGQELTWLDGRPALVAWHRSAERIAALVGGATHLAEDWIGALKPLLDEHSVAIAFSDLNGRDLTSPVGSEQQLLVTRTVAGTRIPWNLSVVSADPLNDFAQLAERRRLMLLGLVTLALFVIVGFYAVMRGVSRELEVARLQSDFVAAVSHEFRTPLTSLRQLAELLSSGRVTSEDRRARYYEIMERESGRLHRLVESLLDFGRMEAGALEFNWERVTPRELVRRVVTEFEAEQGESGCQIEFTTDEAAQSVRADSEAVGRAVWNLLDNAVKYSPNRTTVRVDVSQEQGRVAIAVRDQGVGIPPGEREAIFRKFIRGTSSDGRGTKGTGIGLAMVKHIVEAHGGEVQVESVVGQGSTFTILLPVEE
jgi:signal transduction histidine kinase